SRRKSQPAEAEENHHDSFDGDVSHPPQLTSKRCQIQAPPVGMTGGCGAAFPAVSGCSGTMSLTNQLKTVSDCVMIKIAIATGMMTRTAARKRSKPIAAVVNVKPANCEFRRMELAKYVRL